MTPVAADGLPYRAGVGVMLLNARGEVFTGRRIDTTAEAWQMPQGGIDAGETPRQALFRELEEETGITNAEIIAEAGQWHCYDLPDRLVGKIWRGRYRGQRQKWFLMRFRGRDRDINIATAHPEFEAWRWMPIDRLAAAIVDFKRPLYAQLVAEFGPLAKPVSGTGEPA